MREKCKGKVVAGRVFLVSGAGLFFLRRANHYVATLFKLSVAKLTAMLPRFRDSFKSFQGFLKYLCLFQYRVPYFGNASSCAVMSGGLRSAVGN